MDCPSIPLMFFVFFWISFLQGRCHMFFIQGSSSLPVHVLHIVTCTCSVEPLSCYVNLCQLKGSSRIDQVSNLFPFLVNFGFFLGVHTINATKIPHTIFISDNHSLSIHLLSPIFLFVSLGFLCVGGIRQARFFGKQ